MKKFYFYHGLLPLLLLLLATLWLDYFHFDFILSDHLYAVQGYNWNLKENWLLEGIIHRGGRIFVGVCITLNLCALITTWFVSSMANYRRGLIYLLTTVLVSLVVVSGLKAITHIDCPWSFQVYGGEKPVHPVFASIFGTGTGRCFPSGHASGGYAWIALYFFCLLCKPRWRFAGLTFGLLLGAIFGFSQQFRGAHLLSHDIWTVGICWFTALIGFIWTSKKPIHVCQAEVGGYNPGYE
ncbi:MAG: phosphatase PAP2 family protein [Porticoccaceae bacterium]|nr:phosphatase PAP2 family protein [Pseudomonadales bacterium]MCP5171341.1 phosphatase PAP2 family protein [Pseudomonadales bacterium]